MAPYDWANGGSVDVFFHGEYGSTRGELMLFKGMGMKFKANLCCIAPGK